MSLKESSDRTSAALTTLNNWIYEQTGQQLSDVQLLLIKACWEPTKKTYEEIATEHNYSAKYLEKRVAPDLWRLLSKATGQRVTKSNCKTVLSKHVTGGTPSSETAVALGSAIAPLSQNNASQGNASQNNKHSNHSSNNLPLSSTFYIQQQPEEMRCAQAILCPGALIRIKAPQKMGKTLLMNRVLAHAKSSGCISVCINFQQADRAILADLNRLLRWVCANLTQQLNLSLALDDFWSEDIGSKMSCTLYCQGYLFPNLEAPLVLALEEVSLLFEYPQIAQDFFGMVRTWHEYTKSDMAWESLRLLLVQSTDAYIPLDINRSPFNVGIEVALKPLTIAQVKELAGLSALRLCDRDFEKLMDLVAGHPYLVQLTFSHLTQTETSFEQFLASAITDTGIFSDHLHRHLWTLKQSPGLEDAFKAVLASTQTSQLPQTQSFKLNSMGLVTLLGNQVQISCQLYQHYFSQRL